MPEIKQTVVLQFKTLDELVEFIDMVPVKGNGIDVKKRSITSDFTEREIALAEKSFHAKVISPGI